MRKRVRALRENGRGKQSKEVESCKEEEVERGKKARGGGHPQRHNRVWSTRDAAWVRQGWTPSRRYEGWGLGIEEGGGRRRITCECPPPTPTPALSLPFFLSVTARPKKKSTHERHPRSSPACRLADVTHLRRPPRAGCWMRYTDTHTHAHTHTFGSHRHTQQKRRKRPNTDSQTCTHAHIPR